jgi:hypothetical protein
MSNTPYQNEIQDKRITSLEDRFNTVCENYNHNFTTIKVDIADIKANQKILMFFMLAVIGTLISLFFK